MRRIVAAAALLLGPLVLQADVGRVRLRADAGRWTITVFASPEPLSAGPIEIAVLVQNRDGGEAAPDADVVLELEGPEGEIRTAPTSPGVNRLVRSAVVDLPVPGRWKLAVRVRRGADAARADGALDVGPAGSRLAGIWPLLALPPFGVLLFAARSALRPRRFLK